MTRTRSSASPGLTFLNADLGNGELTSLRIVGPRLASLGGPASADDSIVDLQGDRVLPGLINAHDHLQLNSLTCPDFHKLYAHARDWIADVDALRRNNPEFEMSVAMPRDERLLVGGVKNLLSGVTTVAHHDPLYPCLSSPDFPTAVVRDYGWSHSLYVDGEQSVGDSYRATPRDWPWIIHAAEGVDAAAAAEFERLDAIGCLGPNTLLVHGIALDQAQRVRLHSAGAGLIWCPSSNLRLFGETARVGELSALGRIAIGTDSRLSGARDMFDELRVAAQVSGLDDRTLESLATRDGARLLRLTDRGTLRVGARADILILPAATRLAAAKRADVRLVMIEGVARYGDRDLALRAAPRAEWAEVRVDGTTKSMDGSLAARLSHARACELGLEISNATWRAA
jgi:cytosine/adenosine deaminase-related metal-dependent hydrolase